MRGEIDSNIRVYTKTFVDPRRSLLASTNNSSRVAWLELAMCIRACAIVVRLEVHCTTIMPRIVGIELLTYWFVRAECSTADEPGQVARIGGLSNFGKVSGKEEKERETLSFPLSIANLTNPFVREMYVTTVNRFSQLRRYRS